MKGQVSSFTVSNGMDVGARLLGVICVPARRVQTGTAHLGVCFENRNGFEGRFKHTSGYGIDLIQGPK